MVEIQIDAWETFKYREVWKVSEKTKKGEILKAENTGFVIMSHEMNDLPKNYIAAVLTPKSATLKLVNVAHFKRS